MAMSDIGAFALRQLLRLPFTHGIWSLYPVGPLALRVENGIFDRPNYAYGVYWSALLAARLGIPRISVAEFGVAGGNGLLALERIAMEVEQALGVGIDVYGFDSGQGMPAPVDYRDMPHLWGEGFYRMDVPALQAKLQRAKLVIGDVRETLSKWRAAGHAPLGFVAFDLDYYSSTKQALTIFDDGPDAHLPRVHCYFDDLFTNDLGCMNPYVGELLAILEFNDEHPDRKVCALEQLRAQRPRWEIWQGRMFAFHDFAHPRYCDLVIPRTVEESQMPLRDAALAASGVAGITSKSPSK